ncbi:hypothetical protein [Allochromatium palmeri]|uniref:DUF2282 domain-containing protein n=1 Tax=Allochromatium palmeri TaxID=231048 RepID=A0A6N8EBC8_9GAMM|nr:hypothetical protein [Allochromatium palmeri]MTW21552.1 hypothetical protein [Allochromatium palmeri]
MRKNRTNAMMALLVLLLAGLATTASARPGPGDGRRGPPPEAIAACNSKSTNDSCSFTGRHDDTITGTCITPPDSDQFACVPEGGPPQHGGR